MAKLSKEEMTKIVSENIQSLSSKSFNVFFYVPDTKGNPNGALEYIYQTALVLKECGYNVSMLHSEKEFVGVGDWLGEKYAALPHKNIETENVEISPSDFLFIPEILTEVTAQTKKLPCKRVMILQNFDYFVEAAQLGATLADLGIRDIITTSDELKERVLAYFPNVMVTVVQPSVNEKFFRSIEPQKLVINVVARNQSDVHKVVKLFYWKYPLYKWVSFRDLRGMSQEAFAKSLREAAITIWIDDNTDFGYTALEALKSGSILVGKIPQYKLKWAGDDEKLIDNVAWFDDFNDLPDLLSSIIRTWTYDNIPEEVYEEGDKIASDYTLEKQAESVKNGYGSIFTTREKEFKEVLDQVNHNVFNNE